MPQLEVGELAAFRVGGEASKPVAVDVGEPQLRSRMGAFLPDGHPHPGRPAAGVQQAGDVRDPCPFPDLPAAVISRRPRGRGNLEDRGLDVLGDCHADQVVQLPTRLACHARARVLKIRQTWPWKDAFLACWRLLCALSASA